MPKDKNNGGPKSLGKALKASKGNIIMGKSSTGGGGGNARGNSNSNSNSSTVSMGSSNDDNRGNSGGGGNSRAQQINEQLRILKQRQLGKSNPGFVVKAKKASALPVLAPPRLGNDGLTGHNSLAPKAFKPALSPLEASRQLVTTLLDGEEGETMATRGTSNNSEGSSNSSRGGGSRKVSGGGGSLSVVRNSFAAFEDHSLTGTPGVSLKQASFSLSGSLLSQRSISTGLGLAGDRYNTTTTTPSSSSSVPTFSYSSTFGGSF